MAPADPLSRSFSTMLAARPFMPACDELLLPVFCAGFSFSSARSWFLCESSLEAVAFGVLLSSPFVRFWQGAAASSCSAGLLRLSLRGFACLSSLCACDLGLTARQLRPVQQQTAQTYPSPLRLTSGRGLSSRTWFRSPDVSLTLSSSFRALTAFSLAAFASAFALGFTPLLV